MSNCCVGCGATAEWLKKNGLKGNVVIYKGEPLCPDCRPKKPKKGSRRGW